MEHSGELAASEEATGHGRRRRVVVATAIGVTVLIALATAPLWSRPPTGTGGSGDRAPTFRLPDIRSPEKTVALEDFRGRPVVLNFWASWCVPCRREMPSFEAAHQEFRDRVEFVGVNHQDSRAAGLELLDESAVSYPSGYDPEGQVASRFGLFGMPTTIFISEDGRIIKRRTGEMSSDELRATIETILPPR